MLEKFNLSDKVALITGAAGLLGYEHACALLEVGSKVVLTDIDIDSLSDVVEKLSINFDSNSIDYHRMDVTNEESIVGVLSKLIKKNIKLDILINNAAIDPKVGKGNRIIEESRLEEFSVDQWNLQISVGLTGAFLCSKVFGCYMSENKNGGVIVNIASDLSVFSPDQRLYRLEDVQEDMQPVKPITYSVIKTGLIGMTRYLSTYWPEKGIRANALSPGGVFNNQDELFVK